MSASVLSPALIEARALLKLAGPAALTYVVSFGLQMISIVSVGHVGARALAASALGNMYCNATGYAWLFGLSNAVDALSSQAVGARNLPRVGHVTQRGITVLSAAIVPVALLWWFSGFIMGHLGQEPETVVLAESFARMLLPGLPAAMAFELLKKHLQSCGAVLPPMAAAALALPLNAALSYALVYHSGLSFLGAPLAIACSQWFMALALTAYVFGHRRIHGALRCCTRRAACGCVRCPCDRRGGGGGGAFQRLPQEVATTPGAPSSPSGARSDDAFGVKVPPAAPMSLPPPPTQAEDEGVEERWSEEGGDEGTGKGEGVELSSMPATPAAPRLDAVQGKGSAAGADERSSTEGLEDDGSVPPAQAPAAAAAEAPPGAITVLVAGGAIASLAKGAGDVTPAATATPSAASAAAAPDADSPADELPPLPSDLDDFLDATLPPWDFAAALSGWPEYVSLGAPSAALLFAEWGGFEAAALIAGLGGTDELAAHTVIAMTTGLLFMAPLGLAVASAVRVGTQLGARDPAGARRTVAVSIALAGCLAAANAGFIFAVRSWWGRLFTAAPGVVALVARWIVLLLPYETFDAVQVSKLVDAVFVRQGVAIGSLRGIGRNGLAAVANLVSFGLFGLPLGWLLAVHAGWGLAGVWVGLTGAVGLSSALACAALRWAIDWERESATAHTRALQTH